MDIVQVIQEEQYKTAIPQILQHIHITIIAEDTILLPAEEQQEKLLTQNAPALLLSYMRPLVASATAASPYPAYHLPFIDFTKEES